MLVRRIARPLFAAWFLSEGWDAFRRPDPHVARTQAAWRALPGDLPEPPDAGRLRLLVRLHGGLMVVAAFLLATGRVPRTAAMVLAGLTAPLALVHQPFGAAARRAAVASQGAGDGGRRRGVRALGATGGVVTAEVPEGGADHREAPERFLRDLSMIGGALVVALDREGRPGVAWRVQHARADRAAAREARAAVVAATKEAKAAVREARRTAAAG